MITAWAKCYYLSDLQCSYLNTNSNLSCIVGLIKSVMAETAETKQMIKKMKFTWDDLLLNEESLS